MCGLADEVLSERVSAGERQKRFWITKAPQMSELVTQIQIHCT